jgi:hypothetical protein
VIRRSVRTAARFVDVLRLVLEGAGPTLAVLVVSAALGVPPYPRILGDLRSLLSLLIG